MGSFYANLLVIGADIDDVVRAVSGRAYLASDGDVVAVYGNDHDPSGSSLPAVLSAALSAVTVSVVVYDSDLFSVEIHADGKLVVSGITPDPAEYFGGDGDENDDDAEGPPDPAAVVAAVGRGDVSAVAAALAADFVFAEERHAAFLEALALPTSSVGWGYGYLSRQVNGDDGYSGPPVREVGG